jgi:hypothetical protein
MGKLVNDMIAAMRNYLEASGWGGAKAAKTETPTARTQASAEAVVNQVLAQGQPEAAVFADSNARAAVGSALEAQPAEAASAGSPKEASANGVETVSALKSANATAAKLSSVAVGESTAAATGAGASAAATVAAAALDRSYRYRLARKNVHVAFANLGQAFQRMMLEPKAHQRFVAELNDLLVQSHVLASQITAAAPLLQSLANVEGYAIEPVQRTLAVIREDLAEAQAGAPPSDDHGERVKELRRALDTMVVTAERAGELPGDVVHDLKLLSHQCKQMLAASMLIRKDASVIRLPA